MQYDLEGRRTRLTWSDGFYVTYDYDNLDEMTGIHENGGTTILASFSYDDLGRRTSRTLANGTSTSYGYDAVSRLTSLSLAGGTNANAVTLSNYSPAGDIGSRANSNDAFAWTQGVNANKSYSPNGLNQYASIAGAAQTYDVKGNMTGTGGVSYAYNTRNQLTVAGTTHLYYNAIGELYNNSLNQTRFDNLDGQIISEFDVNNTILRRYVFGPAGDEPIIWYEGSGTTNKRYMDQDERGSVTGSLTAAARRSQRTAMTSTAPPLRPTRAGSNIQARLGCPRLACITIRPACTRPPSAGSCRPTRY